LKITEQEVRHVAGLANLDLSEGEIARMARELDEILTHVEKLSRLDTSGVEPMAQVLAETPAEGTLRADSPSATLSNEAALANAPQSAAGQFKVPKVIER
jgi:aspartyl-tRNA(Asn)/glutamyl-tRNA(Gln) amidotransferase subunit C